MVSKGWGVGKMPLQVLTQQVLWKGAVAAGLAAIRPLKHPPDALVFIIGLFVAVGLAAIRPLKPGVTWDTTRYVGVAVGLAAIRPLKLF